MPVKAVQMVIGTKFHGLQRPNGLRCKNMCIVIYPFKSSGSHLREYDLIRLSVANTTNKNARGCTTIHTTNRWINTMHISHKSSGVVCLSLVFY